MKDMSIQIIILLVSIIHSFSDDDIIIISETVLEGMEEIDKIETKYPKGITISAGDYIDRVGFTYYDKGLIS